MNSEQEDLRRSRRKIAFSARTAAIPMLTGEGSMALLKAAVQQAGRLIGLDVFRHKPGWQWSHTVEAYYPVNPRPRWGYGEPFHERITEILEAHRTGFLDLLASMRSADFIIRKVPVSAPNSNSPYWDNWFFNGLDATALIGMLYVKKPSRYLEIGSGNSTKFARFAISEGKLNTRLISIDPHPRAEIDAICNQVIRMPFEDCSEAVFRECEPGDVVFFDGSHRTFANSDVNVFFFDFLPKLPPGVLVHIHDIFLPADYPPQWNKRLYTEQYILAALMIGQASFFKTILPNFFVLQDPELASMATSLFPPQNLKIFNNSFWIETV